MNFAKANWNKILEELNVIDNDKYNNQLVVNFYESFSNDIKTILSNNIPMTTNKKLKN